jgi:hypothetical protein
MDAPKLVKLQYQTLGWWPGARVKSSPAKLR